MNPSQRRGLALLSLSIVGALVVFVSVLSYVGDVNAQVGSTREVLALKHDVAAQQVVTIDDLETVVMPERWISSAMVSSEEASRIAGQIARLDQASGAIVQDGMFGPRPQVSIGQVEISASISADSAIGGSVRPGDVVHVQAAYLTTDGSRAVRQIIEGALVLHVGIPTDASNGAGESAFEDDDTVPITFALNADAANCLTYAENFAEDLLLARPGEFARTVSGASNCPSTWETGFNPESPTPELDSLLPLPTATPTATPTPTPTPQSVELSSDLDLNSKGEDK